jgi:hypothetical protein
MSRLTKVYWWGGLLQLRDVEEFALGFVLKNHCHLSPTVIPKFYEIEDESD